MKPLEGGLQPSPETSPDEISSPNPDQAAPLLQAQQRPPSQAETEEMRPGSAGGTAEKDAEIIDTGAVKEGADIQISLTGTDREQSEQDEATEKDRTETRKDRNDEEAADPETADEGLPPSNGSEEDSEEKSEGPSDANNNSLETPRDHPEDFIDIPDPAAQVGHTDVITDAVAVRHNECLSTVRRSEWRRRTALMKSKWFWWTTPAPSRCRLTWTTATQ